MAKMMLHRDVLKNFGKLPAKVQKKVVELTQKFEEDSTQASIHLEPLNAVKDSKVRSARVGADYRAIVIAPEKGDTFLLMHIDHHDEAYEWCRNKRFEAHQALGTLQVFDVEEAERSLHSSELGETEAASSEALAVPEYALQALSDEELFQAGVPEALIPAVRAVRNDDDFERLADYLPPEAAQVLYGVASGMPLDGAINEMLGALEEIEKPTGPGDFSHLADITNMDLVLVQGEEHLREILSEDIEEWRVFLHPYQRKLVEWHTRGPMKIFGAAGTGKTVALMHRAAWLAQSCSNDEKVLITTFTTNLSVTIKGLMEKLAPSVVDRIEVTNLHQLARTICARAQWQGKIAEREDLQSIWRKVLAMPVASELDFSGDFVRDEFEQIIDPMGITSEEEYLTVVRTGRKPLRRKQRKALWKVFVEVRRQLSGRNLLTFDGLIHQAHEVLERGEFPRYRHVLVDEIQDFSLEALRLVASISPIAEGLDNPLCVVGDGHQRIYNPVPVPLGRAGIEVRGRSRRLKINYRTSEEIRDWAHAALEGLNVDDLDGEQAMTQGDRSIFHGPEPQLVTCGSDDEVASAVVTWVKGLTESGQLKTHEICLTPANSRVISALQSNGFATVELKARQADPGQEESGVRFGSKKRIKGLEFKAVAILDAGTRDSLLDRFENYVAATRARQQLLVINRPGREQPESEGES
ncbi:AAA family ATPase [Halomonas sp. 18H]|nr:UvrD-helicase domain-containing protein [Halomonas sp. 18H]MCW4153819.1 AAA family ATPase [Halomonas sp. 18H]